MKMFTKIALATAAAALATSAMAQPKPEAFVKERKAAFTLMAWYFGPLAAVAKGEKPFNKDDAVRATSMLVPLSKMPWEGFAPGTDKVGNTEAKAEVWSNNAKFKELGGKLETEMAKLATFANAGDAEAFKKQFGAVGGTCKSCHDDFKKKS